MSVWIVDTGPLVAVLNRSDTYHAWALEHFGRLRPPLVTCEAVLSEASYLLEHGSAGARALLEFVDRGVVQVDFHFQNEVERVQELSVRYASVPMSFADACLVRMTELHHKATLWTIDTDFAIYRRNGRQRISTLMPPPR
jgi:predicted nucleic acid-binding protein